MLLYRTYRVIEMRNVHGDIYMARGGFPVLGTSFTVVGASRFGENIYVFMGLLG